MPNLLGTAFTKAGHLLARFRKHFILFKHLLLAVLIAALLSACSGEAYSPDTALVEADMTTELKSGKEVNSNYMVVGSEDYELLKPNFYYATDNWSFWSIQANIAEGVHDIEALNVIRIDVTKENGRMPTSLNKTFSIEDSDEFEKFPGNIYVFNGEKSTQNRVEEGVISFQSESTDSDYVSGIFHVILTDYDSLESPAPQHRISGIFAFEMGTYSAVNSPPEDDAEDDDELAESEIIHSI